MLQQNLLQLTAAFYSNYNKGVKKRIFLFELHGCLQGTMCLVHFMEFFELSRIYYITKTTTHRVCYSMPSPQNRSFLAR